MASEPARAVYVLDCGGQYCHLIASRIRRLGTFSKVVPCDGVSAEWLKERAGAIVVSGGPESVFDASSRRVDRAIWQLDVPILGICYGCQMLCQDLGGRVEAAEVGEFGEARLQLSKASTLLPTELNDTVVWMSHRDRVVDLPPDFETVGWTAHSPHACVAHISRPIFGLQLHPEVKHTAQGDEILGRFVDAAGLRGNWDKEDFMTAEIERIKARAGDDKSVFVLVSGGVDSTVAYALVAKALPPNRVAGLYVDTGMMRLNETELVRASLQAAGLNDQISYVDASDEFLRALEGVVEPEHKRRIIGAQFVQVQRTECAKLFAAAQGNWLLGQGTIYPDTIESGGDGAKKADVIKTHHNRVPEIDELLAKGLVIEPLAALYKDEVREVGEQLGLPSSLVWRHPFPGPGLGVRLLCVGAGDQPSSIVLRQTELDLLPPGVHADVPPLRSVGCQGDSRTYRNFVVLSGAYPRDWDTLNQVATQLVNQSDRINRVVISLCRNAPTQHNGQMSAFTLTPGAPHTVTRNRLDLLRKADDAVGSVLSRANLMRTVWQCPVAMAPITLDPTQAAETIILRPVDSTEAMTATFSKLPWSVVDQLRDAVTATLADACSDVLFDITNKPPGTIEWE